MKTRHVTIGISAILVMGLICIPVAAIDSGGILAQLVSQAQSQSTYDISQYTNFQVPVFVPPTIPAVYREYTFPQVSSYEIPSFTPQSILAREYEFPETGRYDIPVYTPMSIPIFSDPDDDTWEYTPMGIPIFART